MPSEQVYGLSISALESVAPVPSPHMVTSDASCKPSVSAEPDLSHGLCPFA